MAQASPAVLSDQMAAQRRTVDFDTYDIQVQQLLLSLEKGQIQIAPVYQRQFRWDDIRCSQLIESLILGIPVPNLFMATNADGSWEVVDGLQRLSAIIKFVGNKELRTRFNLGSSLTLIGLEKITEFNDRSFRDLPSSIRTHFETRPLKVVTLSDKSDTVVRFDLFERLNTGGINLTPQEIRSCVYQGALADKLDDLQKNVDFKTVIRLTQKQWNDGTAEECILRFFAFLDSYMTFEHSVKEFLNGYMKNATSPKSKFNLAAHEKEFKFVFGELANIFPDGIMRPGRKGNTPINLYEGIAVGAALALRQKNKLSLSKLKVWMGSEELRRYTTAGTNNLSSVRGRIHFCRDRFLGVPYVPTSED